MSLKINKNVSNRIIKTLIYLLSMVAITTSLSMIIIGYFINGFIRENDNISDGNNVFTSSVFIVGTYDVVSFINILLHGLVFGIHRLARKSHGNQRLQMRMFGVMVTIQIISSFSTVALYFIHKTYHETLVQNIVNDALHLIGEYDENPSIRNSLDILQTRYHCCGFKDFVDWFIYRHDPPIESQPINEFKDIADLSLTSHSSLPDSCCDPNSYSNLCLLSSNVERNTSYGYRVGCAEKMEEDVGMWLKFALFSIFMCLLAETSLIPLMIMYCQLFNGFILITAENSIDGYQKFERQEDNKAYYNHDDDVSVTMETI